MSAALDFTYQYAFPSGVAHSPAGKLQLALATCDANHAQPHFFDGRVRQPRIMGEMLYTLSDVVRTHFFLPRPVIMDPVLTSNEHLLRLEGFSGCCGVYLQALFEYNRPWREAGHLLLCLGLVGKDADAKSLAVDALIEGIEARRFDPELLAETMAGLAEGEWVKFNRLGDTLMQVIQVSEQHAAVVSEALQKWLPRLDPQQKNAFRVLEVIVEAQAIVGQSLGHDASEALRQIDGSGKSAKLAKQLLQL